MKGQHVCVDPFSMDYISLGLIGLFSIGFLSATILPLASEGVLIAFLYHGFNPVSCFFVISIGNTLGSFTNYLLGYYASNSFRSRKKDPHKYMRFKTNVQKYGVWLGLLSWVPILGDPLTIAMGYFKVRFVPMASLIFIGKSLRYGVIIYIWQAT